MPFRGVLAGWGIEGQDHKIEIKQNKLYFIYSKLQLIYQGQRPQTVTLPMKHKQVI